ncbi:Serine/threonine-protein phosphatase 6 regulatory subunit 3-B [Porphyridium purpureum]|uniref:Serine/threonine-protein phosphatase 6 regulatory subunit 3-B n=1 Tax=Porphyridium purpureum TaxID=35688 RepID=A0A5J4YKG2_PORPP|nr:Serine/threonine-protein phosphatase 6 regulatory subunit 3-B [Porphyridium purpureum]|eukprot:POR7560..scf244_11
MYFQSRFRVSHIDELLEKWSQRRNEAKDSKVTTTGDDGGNPSSVQDSIVSDPSAHEISLKELLLDVLNEEDFLQECRSENDSLVLFLSEPAVLREMIEYSLYGASPNLPNTASSTYEDASHSAERFGILSSEALAMEINSIYNTLFDREELLDRFLSVVFDERARASSFCINNFVKIMMALLMVRHHDTVQAMREKTGFLAALVKIIHFASVSELLVRILHTSEQSKMDPASYVIGTPTADVLNFLEESQALQLLSDCFVSEGAVRNSESMALASPGADPLDQRIREDLMENAISALWGITLKMLQMPLTRRTPPDALNIFLCPEPTLGKMLDFGIEDLKTLGNDATSSPVVSVTLCMQYWARLLLTEQNLVSLDMSLVSEDHDVHHAKTESSHLLAERADTSKDLDWVEGISVSTRDNLKAPEIEFDSSGDSPGEDGGDDDIMTPVLEDEDEPRVIDSPIAVMPPNGTYEDGYDGAHSENPGLRKQLMSTAAMEDAILARLPSLLHLLQPASIEGPQLDATEGIDSPSCSSRPSSLGSVRLALIELLCACLRSGSTLTLEKLHALQVPELLLKVVLSHEWNSIAQFSIMAAVYAAFLSVDGYSANVAPGMKAVWTGTPEDGTGIADAEKVRSRTASSRDSPSRMSLTMRQIMWLRAKLIRFVLDAWIENRERAGRGKSRCGFMGHVIRIGGILSDMVEHVDREALQKFVDTDDLNEFDALRANELFDALQLQSRVLGGDRSSMFRSEDSVSGFDMNQILDGLLLQPAEHSSAINQFAQYLLSGSNQLTDYGDLSYFGDDNSDENEDPLIAEVSDEESSSGEEDGSASDSDGVSDDDEL